jgi:hypothetical protein
MKLPSPPANNRFIITGFNLFLIAFFAGISTGHYASKTRGNGTVDNDTKKASTTWSFNNDATLSATQKLSHTATSGTFKSEDGLFINIKSILEM